MRLRIDFVRDYAEVLRARLSAAGYASIPGEKDDDTITRYLNVLNRSIEPRPRQTKRASGFTCPPALQAGLQLFIAESERGANLRAHQSKNITKADFEDGILNDWGIHHFHLGTAPDPKDPRFIGRTGPVLYAAVTPDTLYCLAVLKHGEWSNQQLLDSMHSSFPELTAASSLSGAVRLAVQYTDADIKKLRAAGINVVTQRSDGTIMIGPGGGTTTGSKPGGKSLKVRRGTDQILDALEALQNAVKRGISGLKLPDDIAELDVKLTEANGKLFVSDATGSLTADLGEDIVRGV